MQWLHALADWVVHWAHTPYGGIALFMLAFCESSFFPIPPDLLLIALCAVDSQQSFWYASLCTAGSVLGGIFGYGLGRFGGRPLLERWVRPEKVRLVERYYRRWDVWAVAVAGFTPIPYKVFTISAGAFLLQFGRFVIASTGSRGARFFLVAALFYFFGPAVNSFISKYFNVLSVLFVVLLILGFWILRTVSRGAAQDS
ncbi:MAG: DedA family protein [Deltaproteobacteria bacterium]|nr:DedA family protein [Deltaproteobacteria bacterium]MBW2071704.1 DedA family protein [Deltaproteobacteria bacterium]